MEPNANMFLVMTDVPGAGAKGVAHVWLDNPDAHSFLVVYNRTH
jgi:hypothetical protein